MLEVRRYNVCLPAWRIIMQHLQTDVLSGRQSEIVLGVCALQWNENILDRTAEVLQIYRRAKRMLEKKKNNLPFKDNARKYVIHKSRAIKGHSPSRTQEPKLVLVSPKTINSCLSEICYWHYDRPWRNPRSILRKKQLWHDGKCYPAERNWSICVQTQ